MGVHAAAYDAGEVEIFYIGLHGGGIVEGNSVLIFGEPDACLAEKFEVGLIACECDDVIVGDGLYAIGGEDIHFPCADGLEGGMCVGFYAAFFDTIFDIGFDPVFYATADAFPADDHGHFGSFAPCLQGCIYGGVAGAYHHHFLHGVEMGVLVIVHDLGKVLSGDIEQDGQVVEAGGDDDMIA